MPSKLKKALGAVKDQTSISLAKVVNTNSSNLEVAVLKATSRDEEPIEERYVNEILQTISSNRVHAAICAHVIAKRIGKTKNWVVAIKCLMLVLRIFQDGDPFFPKEVLQARNNGAKILNLSTFRDDSNSSPYDFTAFTRAVAFYLEERLDCFVTGKLQRRFTYKERQNSHPRSRRVNQQPVRDMKPPMLLDRIFYWQRLLDRALGTKPMGSAQGNRLVQVSFYAVARESFDLYRDISDGLGLLLDSFFHLQHQSCVNAYQYCLKATKQFEELSSFYDFCKSHGIGRTSEYPSVQRISDELMDTLHEFLKDQASFPSPCSHNSLAPKEEYSSENRERELQCTSLEDLMSRTGISDHDPDHSGSMTPSFSVDRFSEVSEKQFLEQEDMYNVTETGSNHSLPIYQGATVTRDFVSFDEWPEEDQKPEQSCWAQPSQNFFEDDWLQQDDQKQEQSSQNGTMGNSYINDWLQDHENHEQVDSHYVANGNSFFEDDSAFNSSSWGNNNGVGWELALVETEPKPAQVSQPCMAIELFDPKPVAQRPYNPFVDDEPDLSTAIVTTSNDNSSFPCDDFSFQTTPTFFAQNPTEIVPPTFQATATPASVTQDVHGTTTAAFQGNFEDDPFAPWPAATEANNSNVPSDQQNVLVQQELWLQNQNKIISRHIV
ncbi:ENTH/ANTH/VHS superfamily protein [Corchorus capsularis]|uniref:ENTH/ANTH/VHS superfamily protein n=1 Tax=Corchorus capsularis TaxID=210143 RepID=A0A1R3K8U2_COCAP|nr:ENTH/ANTH/VHS superfamily protein [Corchorus capsularis]